MKKLVKYILVISVMLLTSISVYATCDDGVDGHTCFGSNGRSGHTAAPLDGGLLAILAAAGISYYAVRKKKKK